jgi:ferric-dicitrate binding protein FerR (iron transport regulator)
MTRLLWSISALGVILAALAGVCAGQSTSASNPAAATVVSLAGQVSVMRDANPWALAVGSQVRPGQLIVTGPDGYAEFRVADGSSFEVFPNSRVVFRENPGDLRDLLDMVLGRIKVHIQKWGGQPNPNKVHTPTAIISVRGTTFDVSVEDGEATVVEVEEGQVEVEHRLLPGKGKLLNPGESLRVDRGIPLARRSLDRPRIVQIALRALTEALYTSMTHSPHGGIGLPGGGGGGVGLPGDHPTKPPSAPPPSGPPVDAGPGAPPSPPH